MCDMSTSNEKEKLVLKIDMLDFKGIIMTEISFCMYLVCYKLSISLVLGIQVWV